MEPTEPMEPPSTDQPPNSSGLQVFQEGEPEIEHISVNYVSLRNIICGTTNQIGKELANFIRVSSGLPNDQARKEQFYEFLTAARQELVKVYVLCKWAKVSTDISKAIDVTNWLRGQINCYSNVINAIYMLQNNLNQAKAIPADLNTAIRVYKYGTPEQIPESKYFIPEPKLSNNEVLSVLKRLDVLLTVRLSLHENLPLCFRDYRIKDGRCRFNIGFSDFYAEFSVADDELGTKSKFFLVDFGSDKGEVGPAFKFRLESLINGNQESSLVENLTALSLFAANYKLQTLERAFRKLEFQAGPWAGVISHTLDPKQSILTVNYFLNTACSQQFVVKLSDSAPYALECEPFCQIPQSADVDEIAKLLLNSFTYSHAKAVLSKAHAPFVTKISDLKLLIQLSNTVSTELTIDITSGNFVLNGKGEWFTKAQQQLNSGAPIINVLQDLKIQTFLETLSIRASTVGWIPQKNIRLAHDEWKKLDKRTNVLILKLKNTLGWCICVAMGAEVDPMWYATRLNCSHNRWYLGPLHDVETSFNIHDPDYASLVDLMEKYSVLFVLFELVHELTAANVKHKIQPDMGRIIIEIDSIIHNGSQWAHTGLICTVGDDEIIIEGRARPHRLDPLGDIDHEIDGTSIKINTAESKFVISTKRGRNQVSKLQNSLITVHNAAKSFISTAKLGMHVTTATLNSLDILYAGNNGVVSVQNGQKLHLNNNNPQYVLSPFLPEVGKDYSLVEIVTFLKEWYPIWDFLTSLSFNNEYKDIVAIPQNINTVRVQRGYESNSPCLEITYRKLRNKKSINFITARNGAELIETVRQWFTKPLDAGVVPLITGCVVDIGSESALIGMIKALN